MEHKKLGKTESLTLTEEQVTNFMKEFDATREEVLEFLVEFNAYDIDGNGKICFEEVCFVNKAFEWNIEEGDLQEWIKKGDISCDGKVSFDEFLRQRKKERLSLTVVL